MRAFSRPDIGAFLRLFTLVRFPRAHVFSFGLIPWELVANEQPCSHDLRSHAATQKSSLVHVSLSHVFSLVLSSQAVFQMFWQSNVFQRRSKDISEHHVLYCLAMFDADIWQFFFFFSLFI